MLMRACKHLMMPMDVFLLADSISVIRIVLNMLYNEFQGCQNPKFTKKLSHPYNRVNTQNHKKNSPIPIIESG